MAALIGFGSWFRWPRPLNLAVDMVLFVASLDLGFRVDAWLC